MNDQPMRTRSLDIACIDELTGVYNRRFLNKFLTEDFTKFKTIAMFMMDIDDFKKVNDKHGHLEGDALLVSFCGAIKESVADNGIVIRYGGDEFSVVLTEKTEEEVLQIAEKILMDLSSKPHKGKNGKSSHTITASLGIAFYPADAKEPQELLNKADEALYSSKRAGRNQVTTCRQIAEEVSALNEAMKELSSPRFVDRQEELASLKAVFNEKDRTRERSVLITGVKGIGKSRLLNEFLRYAPRKKASIMRLRTAEYDSNRPYGILADGIIDYVKSFPEQKRRALLSSISGADAAELVNFSPAFKDFISADKTARVDETDTKRRLNLFNGLSGVFKEIIGDGVLILAIDDLHWIDFASLGLITYLLKDRETRLFLYATALEDKPFQSDIPLRKVRLGPLTKKDVKSIITTAFGSIELDAGFLDMFYKKTLGNPFFITEVLKLLIDRKRIHFRDRKWHLAAKRERDIPSSLEETEMARFEKFDEGERNVIVDAALLGDNFNLDTLKEVSEKSEAYILGAINTADKLGLVKSKAVFDTTSFGFVNSQIKDLLRTLAGTLKARQAHKKIASVLEGYHKTAAGVSAGEVAAHYKLAGEEEKVRSYVKKLSELTARVYSPEDMRAYLESLPADTLAPSVEEMLEKPLSKESKAILPDAALALRGAIELALLYPPNNQARIEHKDEAYKQLGRILAKDKSVTFSVVENQLLINGEELSSKKSRNTIGTTFVKVLSGHRINSITFKQGMGEYDLGFFLEALAKKEAELVKAGGFSKMFAAANVLSIKIDQVRYEKAHKAAAIFRYPALQDFLGGMEKIPEGKTKSREELKETIDLLYGMMKETEGDQSGLDEKIALILDSLDGLGWPLTDLEPDLQKELLARGLSKEEAAKLLKSALHKKSVKELFSEEFLKDVLGPNFNENIAFDARSVTEGLLDKKKEEAVLALAQALLKEAAASDKERLRLIAKELADLIGVILSKGKYSLLEKFVPHIPQVLFKDEDTKISSLISAPFIEIFEKEELTKDPFGSYVKKRKAALVMKALGPVAISGLSFRLSEQDPKRLRSILTMAGYMGDKAIVPGLRVLVKYQDQSVKEELVRVLQRLGGIESVRLLVELLAYAKEELYKIVMITLTDMCDEKTIPELEKHLSDPRVGASVKKIISYIRKEPDSSFV